MKKRLPEGKPLYRFIHYRINGREMITSRMNRTRINPVEV
jgi:hypothetical protein